MSYRRYTNRALIFWLILAVVAGVAWVVKAMFGRIARTKKAPDPLGPGAVSPCRQGEARRGG
mgnify:CR=1 FL=1